MTKQCCKAPFVGHTMHKNGKLVKKLIFEFVKNVKKRQRSKF